MNNREQPELQQSVRVGILGAGFIADFHAQALSRLAKIHLVAICDIDEGNARACAARWHVPSTYTSLDEMVQVSRPDVIHILLPPSLHTDAAVRCLELGCHVLIEKPLGLSSSECRRIMTAARMNGRVAGVNHNAVFHPVFLQAVDVIRRRELGAIEHVTACVSVPLRQLSQGQDSHWMFRKPGNIILEQAPHPLSQIQLLLGDVRGASAMAGSPERLSTGAQFHRKWQIALECQRGTAQCLLSFGTDHAEQWLHIIGQDGSIFADLRRNILWGTAKSRFIEPVDNFLNAARQAGSALRQGLSNIAEYSLSFVGLRAAGEAFPMSIQNSIGAFYRSIRSGEPFAGNLQRGLAVVEACEAIIATLAAGAVLDQEVTVLR